MNDRSNFIIKAHELDDIGSYCDVFDRSCFGPEVHIKLPEYILCDYRIMRIYNTYTDDSPSVVDYNSSNPLWLDIPIHSLDLRVNQIHTYTIEFINNITSDTYNLYFRYRLYSSNVDKPYIYMNRK